MLVEPLEQIVILYAASCSFLLSWRGELNHIKAARSVQEETRTVKRGDKQMTSEMVGLGLR